MTGITVAAGLLGLPAGIVLDHAGAAAPPGAVLCYGQNVSRATYAALFAAIGTTYGAGDGTTTFGIPDARGRATFGKDNMGGSAANRVTNGNSGITGTTLGAAGGDERTHGHTHFTLKAAVGVGTADASNAATYTDGAIYTIAKAAPPADVGLTSSTGAGASQNMPPALVLNKIITTGGV